MCSILYTTSSYTCATQVFNKKLSNRPTCTITSDLYPAKHANPNLTNRVVTQTQLDTCMSHIHVHVHVGIVSCTPQTKLCNLK